MSARPRTFAACGALLAVLLTGVACSGLFTTDIREIKRNPQTFHGKQVTVSGEVTNTIKVLGLGYFEVADDTGTIGVVTRGAVPKKGERVVVKGKVDQAFALAGRSLVVIVQDQGGQ